MAIFVVGLAALICAFLAVRRVRLLTSALYLAATSALTALLIYLLGAPEVAVIELSVGAGLVTILFVFAINIAGDLPTRMEFVVPRPVAWGLVIITLLLLGVLNLPSAPPQLVQADRALFTKTLWEERGLDTLLQLVIIFAGALGVLGLLVDNGSPDAEEGER